MADPRDASRAGNPDEPDSGPRPFAWKGTGDVLVADDEPAVRAVTVRGLERLGLTATAAADGDEAVRLYREDPARWRLVVLDLTMPKLNGLEAIRAIRALRATPVILSSGYAEDELRRDVTEADGIAFLQKPFTVRSLSEAVRKVLGPGDA